MKYTENKIAEIKKTENGGYEVYRPNWKKGTVNCTFCYRIEDTTGKELLATDYYEYSEFSLVIRALRMDGYREISQTAARVNVVTMERV